MAIAALGVWRRGWLTAGGALAAAAIGSGVSAAAGGGALALLLLFFVSSSLLTGLCRAVRSPMTPGRERGSSEAGPDAGAAGGRRARQVLANGGVAALAALCGLAGWLPSAHYALVGALAAATADTWATEVGTAAARTTRRATTWRRVRPGSSGGISLPGTAAGGAGAALLGGAAGWFLPGTAGPWLRIGFASGVLGMMVDSLLGASVEGRRAWIDNDIVNLGGTLAGATCAWLLAISGS